MKHSEIDVKFLWNILSDFWNHFEDKEVVSQVWRCFIQSLGNLYYQLYQISLSKSIETIPYRWISDWEQVKLNKTTYVDSSDSIIYYENDSPVFLKDIDWDDPSLVFSKRNPSGILLFDSYYQCWYVNDTSGLRHYRDFPHEYMLPAGLKDVVCLVETPRNGVKFPQRAFSSEDDIITYDNGYVRPFKTEYLTDRHGFDTDYVANGVFASGESGTQDFIVMPSATSNVFKIAFKSKVNTIMWAHVGIRQSYNLYESFGYLLKFFRGDNLKYLRELQGLWLSYFSSPTISALKRGFTVLRSLPFALQSGVVTSLSQQPSRLIINHVNPVYQLAPNEDTTLYDPRNSAYNPYDWPILTDKVIYEVDGLTREAAEDPELDAKPFIDQALSIGDYVYSLNEQTLTAAFSFKGIEETVPFPTRPLTPCTDLTVVSSFINDDRYCIRLSDRILYSYIPFDLPAEGSTLEIDEYNRIAGTPFPAEALNPISELDIITDVVPDGRESYIEINHSTRFLITEHDANALLENNIKGFTVLGIEGSGITLGSLANVKLDSTSFYSLQEGDYISYISPAVLTVGINGTIYTYNTDSTLNVSQGQYIEKYDPLVSTVQFKDYITDPSWVLNELGNVDVSFDKILSTIADMWHSFLVEVDEYSAPDTFETSKLIHTFIKDVKPTYVDYRMIENIFIDDTMTMSDEFDKSLRYELEMEYPWAGRGLLIFDNDCFFDDYYFDDKQRFDDSDFADPMFSYTVRDTLLFEDNLYLPTCLNDGMIADGTGSMNSSSDAESVIITEHPATTGTITDSMFTELCYDMGMLFDNNNIFDVSCDELEVTTYS